MTADDLIDAIPDLRTFLDEGRLTWEEFLPALDRFGATAPFPGGDDAKSAHDALALIVPGTETNIKIGAAGLALLRIVVSGGALLVPGPHSIAAWGGGINFADACHRLYKSVQPLNMDRGEFCVYLALGETGSRDERSAGVYPTAEQVALTLEAGGIEWCGLRCRFHRRHRDSVDGAGVGAVLAFLAEREMVERKTPNTWWIV